MGLEKIVGLGKQCIWLSYWNTRAHAHSGVNESSFSRWVAVARH